MDAEPGVKAVALIDVTYGNVPQDIAERMAESVRPDWLVPLGEDYPAGATEPWVSAILMALLKATGVASALETGAFLGHTSLWLKAAILEMGGDPVRDLWLCEIDPERAIWVRHRTMLPTYGDAIETIPAIPDRSLGLAFVDDDHAPDHVGQEIQLLYPKMAQGGIICFHDVYGSCDLQRVVSHYGGYCIDLPRCGPAGGLGILQVR